MTEIHQENLLAFSCQPEQPAESLADEIKERACRFLSRDDERVRLAIESAIDSANVDDFVARRSESSDEWQGRVAELLMLFASAENARLLAHCFLLVIDRSPYSEVQIAQMLGVTKAAVSKVKVSLQNQYGFRCRVGRSDVAREKFREITRRRAKIRIRTTTTNEPTSWPHQNLFRNALSRS